MQIVQFDNGNYALRKKDGSKYLFMDLKHSTHWWPKGSTYIKDCLTEDLGKLEKILGRYIDTGSTSDMGSPLIDTQVVKIIEAKDVPEKLSAKLKRGLSKYKIKI